MARDNVKSYIGLFIVIILLFPAVSTAASLVIIDPGHGGNDRGVPIAGSLHEKDLTLDIAKNIGKAFKNDKNIHVLLTRSDDRDISLPERLNVSGKKKPDLFISLHVNAGFDRKASGFEVHYRGFGGSAEVSGGGKAIARDMVTNRALNESNRFGRIVLKHLDPLFPRGNRNLRETAMFLFEDPSIPAVLVETGFATHPEDRKRLEDQGTPQAIASAISAAVREFFHESGAGK